ncbi:MAG: histone H1 [Anaerolineaceae bacterium]|nr:histone H1 [Anaerolineaceae bacterium]
MEAYETLKALVAEVEGDLGKAESGNKAAGTRVRKQMQEIKKAAQAVRQGILELRSS